MKVTLFDLNTVLKPNNIFINVQQDFLGLVTVVMQQHWLTGLIYI